MGNTLLPAVAKGGSTSWGIGSASGNEVGFELEVRGALGEVNEIPEALGRWRVGGDCSPSFEREKNDGFSS